MFAGHPIKLIQTFCQVDVKSIIFAQQLLGSSWEMEIGQN